MQQKLRVQDTAMCHVTSAQPHQSMRGVVPSLPASHLCADTLLYLQASITYKNMKALHRMSNWIFPHSVPSSLSLSTTWDETGCPLLDVVPWELALKLAPGLWNLHSSLIEIYLGHPCLEAPLCIQLVKTAACFP